MKCVSFNVNSVRTRLHQLAALVELHAPDIIGLQETKVTDDDFPLSDIQALGYEAIYTGQKTHYGVALLAKHPFVSVQKGFPGDGPDEQKRFIAAQFKIQGKTIHVLNGYFPQGENRDHPVKFPNKSRFYKNLSVYLNDHLTSKDLVIVMGDMNISHTDLDIGIGEENRKRWLKTGKCSFLPEERTWMNDLLAWGLFDTYRQMNPISNEFFSWFDYRSAGFDQSPKRGLRIDLILATEPLTKLCKATGIDYDIRAMERPSDHCPVWAAFEL
jgi:exodeoxyribonuclease III